MQDDLSDILQLSELLRLNDQEDAALRQYAPGLTRHIAGIVEHFYTWLGSIPATANFISPLPPEQLERLKRHLAEHFRVMLLEDLDSRRAEQLVEL